MRSLYCLYLEPVHLFPQCHSHPQLCRRCFSISPLNPWRLSWERSLIPEMEFTISMEARFCSSVPCFIWSEFAFTVVVSLLTLFLCSICFWVSWNMLSINLIYIFDGRDDVESFLLLSITLFMTFPDFIFVLLNECRDVLDAVGSLLGQLGYLVGNNGEAASLLTGPWRPRWRH